MQPEGDPTFRQLYHQVVKIGSYSLIEEQLAYVISKFNFPVIGGSMVCIGFSIGDISVLFSRVYIFRSKIIAVDFSPTFESMDGEYHFMLDTVEGIRDKTKDNEDVLATLEKFLLDKSGEIGFSYIGEQRDVDVVESARVTLLLFSLSWIFRFTIILPLHIESNYLRCMDKFGPPPLTTDEMVNILKSFYRIDVEHNKSPWIGSKMIPLSVQGLINTENPTFSPWNEILAQRLAYDLVINNACKAFAPVYFWGYFKTDQTYYQNKNMLRRFEYSAKAIELIEMVDEFDETMSPIEYDVQKLVSDTKKQLILSDYSIIYGTRHTGATLSTFMYKPKLIANPLFDPDIFTRVLLGYVFAISALHRITNIVHADLHLNNVLLTVDNEEVSDILYFGMSQIDSYRIEKMRDTCIRPYIIDFSRSIFTYKARPILEKIVGKTQSDEIFMNQDVAILQLFARVINNVKEHQELLRGLVFTDFQEVTKLLDIVDFYLFFSNMKSAFTGKNISAEVVQLVTKGEKFCKEGLMKNFHHLVKRDFGKINATFDVDLRQQLFGEYSMARQPTVGPDRVIGGGRAGSNRAGHTSTAPPLLYNLNAEYTLSTIDPSKKLIKTTELQTGWDDFDRLLSKLKTEHPLEIPKDARWI